MKLPLKLGMLCFSVLLSGQTTKKLNDPSIVAHYKRNTFEAWGDWRPYPKYVLGIQTNFAYATVWGMWAPAKNKAYKNGPDIRPLKADGEEVQRLALAELQRTQTEEIMAQADSLRQRSLQDFAHWTSATVDADPLWLLYYKRMLKPLKDFPENPKSYSEWGFPNQKVYESLQTYGHISTLQEQLDILKDKYHQARTMDMPRGKRFLMYHKILQEWRGFQSKLKNYSNKGNLFQEYKDLIAKVKSQKENFTTGNHTMKGDKEIVTQIMDKYKHQF